MKPDLYIPGVQILEELGRNEFWIGYLVVRQGRQWILETPRREARQLREFYRQSGLQARLQIPGLPRVLEVGTSGGRIYRLREYVEGRSLAALIAEAPVNEDRMVSIARALALALAEFHARGLLHGRLYPDGCRIDRSGTVRLIDMGLALHRRQKATLQLGAGESLYAAPEAQESGSVRLDYSADLYAIGAILYALGNGHPPSITRKERQYSCFSPALAAVIRRLLQVRPSQRYRSATGLLADLRRLPAYNAALELGQKLPLDAIPPIAFEQHLYPLVGRQSELKILRDCWLRTSRGQGSHLVLVGPTGIGKDRLMAELGRALQATGAAVHEAGPGQLLPLLKKLQEANSPALVLFRQASRSLPALPDLNQSPILLLSGSQEEPEEGMARLRLEPLSSGDLAQLARQALNSSEIPPNFLAELGKQSQGLAGVLLTAIENHIEEGLLRPCWGGWQLTGNSSASTSGGWVVPRAARLRAGWEQIEPARPEAFLSLLADEFGADRALVTTRHQPPREPTWKRLIQDVELSGEVRQLETRHCYPMRVCGVCVAYLLVEFPRPPEGWGSVHHSLLQSCADSLAARLELETSPRASSYVGADAPPWIEALQILSAASLDLADVLERLLEAIGLLVPFFRARCWLEEEGQMLPLMSQTRGRSRLSGAFAESSGERGALEDALTSLQPGSSEEDAEHWLALPLVVSGKSLGAITLCRRSGPFAPEEGSMALTLARQAGVALANARAFGQQQALLAKTRYRFLAAQIRPHFLFNALNTLASLVAVDAERAEQLVLDLADFFRETFAEREDSIPLSDEVRHLGHYLAIEKARFGQRLYFECQADAAVMDIRVPALTLQPLIENAVRHGVSSKPQGGRILLRIEPARDGAQIQIEDDGIGFDPLHVQPSGTGVGLKNVQERLEDAFGAKEVGFRVESAPGKGCKIRFQVQRHP